MNADEIVRALRCVQEKHRNDHLMTFQTDVSAMARDAADMIESLQAQLNDVVPAARCGECRWFADNNGGNWFGCQMFNAIRLVPEDAPKENDYCSYGEKMEEK